MSRNTRASALQGGQASAPAVVADYGIPLSCPRGCDSGKARLDLVTIRTPHGDALQLNIDGPYVALVASDGFRPDADLILSLVCESCDREFLIYVHTDKDGVAEISGDPWRRIQELRLR